VNKKISSWSTRCHNAVHDTMYIKKYSEQKNDRLIVRQSLILHKVKIYKKIPTIREGIIYDFNHNSKYNFSSLQITTPVQNTTDKQYFFLIIYF